MNNKGTGIGKRGVRSNQKVLAIDMARKGVMISQISKDTGLSETTIYQYCREENVVVHIASETREKELNENGVPAWIKISDIAAWARAVNVIRRAIGLSPFLVPVDVDV